MKKIYFLFSLLAIGSSLYSQNTLLQNPSSGVVTTKRVSQIEMISNGTDAALVLGSNIDKALYVVDINDKNAASAVDNAITEITGFRGLIEAAAGQSSVNILDIEVNPISKSIYVLAEKNSSSPTFIVKVEKNGAKVSVVNLSNQNYSKINWSGSQSFICSDITWGNNTLFVSSGSFSLNGSISAIDAPFKHNSSTVNRSTTMFKSNWGGSYFTTAPLEKIAFASINNENRLLGVTTCAPGFSFPTSKITGTGTLQVKEVFNVNYLPPLKVIHQNHNGTDYLFDLHTGTNKNLIRVGEQYLDGSPDTKGQINNDAIEIRDDFGNRASGLTDAQVKVYPNAITNMAKWDECNLLVLEANVLKLFQTGNSSSCSSTVSVKNILSDSQVKITPNPSNDFVNVSINTELNSSDWKISILNSLGQNVISRKLNNESNHRLDVSGLESGLYFISIQSKDQKLFTKQISILK